jgi:ribonuclease HII
LNRSGTDEAGRGSIVGPMVIGSVLLDKRGGDQLKKLGVKDSKKLSPNRRGKLAPVIEEISIGHMITYVTPWNIDSYVRRRKKYTTLNRLEAEVVAIHLRQLRPSVAYLDSPYPAPKVYRDMVRELVGDMSVRIVSQNRAESAHIEVAAASVLAKVRRDEIIGELGLKLGDFGSGYPSDPRTRRFVLELLGKGEKQPFIRWSWKTIGRLLRTRGYPSSTSSSMT